MHYRLLAISLLILSAIGITGNLPVHARKHRYSANHTKKLELCLPDSDQDNLKKEPFVLFVHGGAWTTGFGSSRAFQSHCNYSAKMGYASANLEYRLAPRYRYPAAYDDLSDAVRWLDRYINIYNATHKQNLSNKILLVGHSAGAHLSLLVAFKEKTLPIYGVVDMAGPTDLTRRSSCTMCQFAKDVFTNGESDYALSPVSWVRHDVPPVFIFHGENDKVVGIEQSYALRDRMKLLHAPVEMMVLKNTGHWFPYANKQFTVAEQSMEFVMETFQKMDKNRLDLIDATRKKEVYL